MHLKGDSSSKHKNWEKKAKSKTKMREKNGRNLAGPGAKISSFIEGV